MVMGKWGGDKGLPIFYFQLPIANCRLGSMKAPRPFDKLRAGNAAAKLGD